MPQQSPTAAALALLGLLMGSAGSSQAQPFPRRDLPPELAAWAAWALDDDPDHVCPARGDTVVCLWPGRLRLDLGPRGGTFRQEAYADRELYLPLPGSSRVWPQGVTLDARPAPVIEREGVPAIRLAAGRHVVSGSFVWSPMPDSLPVPPGTALVSLEVDGLAVGVPMREEDGLLWLRRGGARGAATAESLRLDVFRKVKDGVPIFVETSVNLEVSGKAREVTLEGMSVAATSPVSTEGGLPVQLEPDGRLRVQVRAGKFTIGLLSRVEGRLEALLAPRGKAPWPQSETWTFEADETLRQVRLRGGTPIDASRTELPVAWRKLPALALAAGERVKLEEIQRGEPEAPPDHVRLEREMWLDLSGRGFTVRDSFGGRLGRTWRLDLLAPGDLGRAAVGGNDELVTAASADGASGFEVRRADLQAAAESRAPRRGVIPEALPAVGWTLDVDELATTLNLPPGWRLIHAMGADRVHGSWIAHWTPLGFFALLLIAAAAGRLFGWRMGLVAFAAVGLTLPEAGAPLWSWLSLLAATAILGARPEGRLGRLARWWWRISAVLLGAILLFFVRDQLRAAFFPQTGWSTEVSGIQHRAMFGSLGVRGLLEPALPGVVNRPAVFSYGSDETERAGEDARFAPPPAPGKAPKQYQISSAYVSLDTTRLKGPAEEKARTDAFSNLAQDPHSTLQTGPGVPRWQWMKARLAWDGPVGRDHRFRLFLLSPGANVLLAILRLGLLVVLAARVFGLRLRPLREMIASSTTPAATASLVLLFGLAGGAADARASETDDAQQTAAPAPSLGPSSEMLEELKARLIRPAACQPSCVNTPLLSLSIAADRLTLRAEVHAEVASVWAVPGPVATWTPAEIRLDGQTAASTRLEDGFLHVRLGPGVHRIEASGPLPPQDSLTLQLKERPRRAVAAAAGWEVGGVRDDGPPDESLQLSRRVRGGSRGALGGGHYSSWLEVRRAIEVGISWRAHTTIRRVSPPGTPIVARIPLLPGEALTEGEWPTEKGDVSLTLGREQTEAAWVSTLTPVETLTLTAPAGRPWSEVWQVECGVVWQCTFEGLPPVKRQSEGAYEPEFRPWPGEELRLRFTRPRGRTGQAATIDQAALDLEPGARLEKARLRLSVRASREETLTVTLPEGARVQNVQLGSGSRPIRPAGGALALSIPPGASSVQIEWLSDRAMGVFYGAPVVRLSLPAANVHTAISLPPGRFPLHVRGPAWGPTLLFWPYLLVILVVANLLARLPWSPLTRGQWVVLGLGLTQVPPLVAVLVAALPVALAWRARRPATHPVAFNLAQILLVIWLVVALGALYAAGMPSAPDMGVSGNGSDPSTLRWYVDRVEGALPAISVVTLPSRVHGLLMLFWSLWIVAGIVRGFRWATRAFTQGGAWRRGARAERSSGEAGALELR